MSIAKIRIRPRLFNRHTGYVLMAIALVLILRYPAGCAEAVQNVFLALSTAANAVGGGH